MHSVGGTSRMDLLVRFGARDLDDALPLRDVVDDVAAELLRIHFHRDRALAGPIVAHLGTSDNSGDLGIESPYDFRWCTFRRHNAKPDHRLVSGYAHL